ncbi:MAG TPA: cyclopropane-fatty-acyl-phospholipid synthase family protein [Thermoanaerobaculia bacterium]|nr:cyclopropane-fatty-acyl-phospholipid synthase family protein [Thermoanaerobaculia bacterium]HUM30236.1 cyclopropane-fatty-acyl-phospholipid synthase family protein [Thermoanaerobaculia bacterium]HXK68468.1 cyclopropane-fatty-acyl-phospholipid synthase family protein [Thermoanaerobaculia bacterium]
MIRWGIRRLLARRLREEHADNGEASIQRQQDLILRLSQSPIALHTRDANEQHYEVPTSFFEKVLGKRLKYSCGYWPEGVRDLDSAEQASLQMVIDRAEIQNGQTILDLGCGWGSLSLFLAENFPEASITSVSNSSTQRTFIENRCRTLGYDNVTVITADINAFSPPAAYDRIISIEMFEHIRNYCLLMNRISHWMKPGGKLFVHHFSNVHVAYPFETGGDSDWMARYFFTGGMMPSDDFLLHFQQDLQVLRRWRLNGNHYRKTCEAWLNNMDSHKKTIQDQFKDRYGKKDAMKLWSYWRVFFMACSELFGYHNGEEWVVSHYLFGRREDGPGV